MIFRNIIAGVVLLLAFSAAAAEPMAHYNPQGKWYDVKSDHYRCTFYEGCMYPVWFYSSDGKKEFPRGFLLDWIKVFDAPDTAIHYLRNDHFAEVKIIENSAEKLIVECTGKYCNGTVRFPGVTAVYRYTLKRNSPEIVLEGTVKNTDKNMRKNCRIYLGIMAFRHRPFDQISIDGKAPAAFRPANSKPHTYKAANRLQLTTADGLLLGVNGDAIAFNNAFDRYYTYLGRAGNSAKKLWDGSENIRFKVVFTYTAGK